ncbi:MAG: TRAP transporter large permease [Sedimentisphaerales bacterium]|nr:TRAP transporter large permease [Sedimentisphaerales bacterium]
METSTISVIILTVSFIIFLAINVPVAVSIGLSAFITCLYALGPAKGASIISAVSSSSDIVALEMATGIDSFSLLAIPFFVLAGLFMARGGIARRLIDFASTLVGRFTGGLAYINILTCMFFGALSGSSIAAVSGVGGCMIPEMNRKGYDKNFNVAVTTTAATTGLLIPPSNIMIVYALIAGSGVSIIAMFMAGILPGIVTGLFLMIVAGIISKKRHYGTGDKATFLQMLKAFKGAFLSLLLIVIVMGGIFGGVFTATEAAAVAVLYAFFLSVIVYREIKIREIPGILLQAGITTSVVMLLIGASIAMSWVMTIENIPQTVSNALIALSSSKIVILLIINAVLLFVGLFMDMTPAVLIFTPIFLPVMMELGMEKIHFGIIMITNLCIGICTPPVGTCLFVACGVGETTISKVLPSMIPFFIAMVAALLLITYIPQLSLIIPQLLGLM